MSQELSLCECGCGGRVSKLGNSFIKGHGGPKKHTEESKQRMSKNSIGKSSGKKHPNFGKHHSEELKRKISKSRIGKKCSEETRQKMSKNNSKENNPNWKGGISCEPYCQVWIDKEFKQDIRDRDGNIAWDIGYWYNGGLSINHINYDKKDCRPKNLITVSRGMNSAINNHKKFYTEWFQTAMSHRLGYSYE